MARSQPGRKFMKTGSQDDVEPVPIDFEIVSVSSSHGTTIRLTKNSIVTGALYRAVVRVDSLNGNKNFPGNFSAIASIDGQYKFESHT